MRIAKWYVPKRLLITLVIAASLPVALILALSPQLLKMFGAPGNASLAIVPGSQNVNVGSAGSVDVFLNPNGETVAGIELVISFDPNIINVTNISPGPFFTDHASTVGNPIEIVRVIANGQIHYAVGFPLGSNFSSTDAKNVAKIDFTAVAGGTSNLAFITSGQPKTTISDINAQDVIDTDAATGGSVNVASAARLYFSDPRPANPQSPNQPFQIDVLADTGGQNIDGIDASIRFDRNVLRVTNLQQGSIPTLPSYPVITYDNSLGTINISTNTGTGATATPANGSSLNIATITLNPIAASSGTQITYDFVAGQRNDSNIVLSGTSQLQDPVDILASVTNANIVVTTPSVSATPTPIPTPTATPIPTPTPTRTATPPLISNTP